MLDEKAQEFDRIGGMYSRHGLTGGCLDHRAELRSAFAQPRISGQLFVRIGPHHLRNVIPLSDSSKVSIKQLRRIIDAARALQIGSGKRQAAGTQGARPTRLVKLLDQHDVRTSLCGGQRGDASGETGTHNHKIHRAIRLSHETTGGFIVAPLTAELPTRRAGNIALDREHRAVERRGGTKTAIWASNSGLLVSRALDRGLFARL